MPEMKLGIPTASFAVLLISTSVTQSDETFFTFHNDVDSDLTELYVGAQSQQGWGSELLGQQGGPVAAGTATSISIDF